MKKIILFILILLILSCSDNSVTLNVKITNMFESILIVNQDNFDYKDLRIEINNEFTLNRPIIKKGETTLVDVFGFVDKHGNRFNPSAKKLMNISIYCHLDNDQVGWFYGTFK